MSYPLHTYVVHRRDEGREIPVACFSSTDPACARAQAEAYTQSYRWLYIDGQPNGQHVHTLIDLPQPPITRHYCGDQEV